jgi:hypothetical protein
MTQLRKPAAGIGIAMLLLLMWPAFAEQAASNAAATAAASNAAAHAESSEPVALGADFWAARADRYSVEWGSVTLGEGTISLKPTGNDCFDYHSETDPIAIVRWTYGSPNEFSTFCVRDGQVYPTHFQYSNDRRSDDNFTLDFDAKTQRVKMIQGGDVVEIRVPDPVYDRFSIQEAVRLWAARNAGRIGLERDFAFLDEKKLKNYRFRIQGHESVKTPAGTFDTLLVERVDNPKKSYRYWLAPSRDYIPVKIEHINKGKTELRMALLK